KYIGSTSYLYLFLHIFSKDKFAKKSFLIFTYLNLPEKIARERGTIQIFKLESLVCPLNFENGITNLHTSSF
ncbi:MAG: hypothetical protein ACUVWN_17385, partial [bacterium]